ncbi:hypothetical protein Tco_1153305 [Tanacetum coccineum]
MPHELPLQSIHSLRHAEGSLSLTALTDLYTSLSKKKLKQKATTNQVKRRAKVVIFNDEEDLEDSSNQGRSLIEEIDLDARISLQLGVFSAATALADAARRRQSAKKFQIYTRRRRKVSTVGISAADINTVGVKAKDKGKAVMHESKPQKKIKKRLQEQISVDEELAKKIFEEEQAKFNAEREARFKARQQQERIGLETALRLQKKLEEKEAVTAKVHDIDWSDPVILRHHTLQNRPFSKTKVRKNMCLYLKNQGGYKMSHFKGIKYEDIRPIFERVWDQVQAFIPIGYEIEKEIMKRSGFEEKIGQPDDEQDVKESSSTTRRKRKKSLTRKSAKKQKLEDDVEKEELQAYLNIVPKDESFDV